LATAKVLERKIKKKVVLDTDPGVDDAMALAFLMGREDIALQAITTVFGNADVETTTRNALFLAQKMSIPSPVHAGAAAPLRIARRPSPAHIHGDDALGGLGLAADFSAAPATGAAADALIDLIRANPGEISILAIAPLTNLALALAKDPGIAPLVREVVVMGGAFGWGARRGNVSPAAEANIANDPHAADLVLSAPWPVTMVGLDVTSACILPAGRARQLASDESGYGRLLWDISRSYEEVYRTYDGIDGFCIHDVAAAACLVAPSLFGVQSGSIRVVTDGIAAGQTIQKPQGQFFPPGAWDNLPEQKACTSVDAEGLVNLYEETLRNFDRKRAALAA
jgi:inosine-uridine nucleoside N-ribohydrolase